MLINEFDLDLSGIGKKMRFKDEVVTKPKITPLKSNFYWFQTRNEYDYNIDDVVNDGINHMIYLMKRNRKGNYNFRKGIYTIMPNFTIVIK